MTIYKPHFACFECRKTFKRRLLRDIRKGYKLAVEAKCPECGNLTADMGLDFESPRKDDHKSWEHTKNLFMVGVTFHSCGCIGPGYIPKSFEQLLELLMKKKQTYIANLRFWLNRNEANNKAEMKSEIAATADFNGQIPSQLKTKRGYVKPQEAVDFWNEKLSALDDKIQHLHKQSKQTISK